MLKIEAILQNTDNISHFEIFQYLFVIHLKNGTTIEIQHDAGDKLNYNFVEDTE